MKYLLLLVFCSMISCEGNYRGGYKYNERFTNSDSLEIEQEIDSFSINNRINIGPKISDTLIIE